MDAQDNMELKIKKHLLQLKSFDLNRPAKHHSAEVEVTLRSNTGPPRI
jgi:hypothetical protein